MAAKQLLGETATRHISAEDVALLREVIATQPQGKAKNDQLALVTYTEKRTETRLLAHPRAETRARIFAVHFGNEAGADFCWADGFAFVGVGAIAKTFHVHLPD